MIEFTLADWNKIDLHLLEYNFVMIFLIDTHQTIVSVTMLKESEWMHEREFQVDIIEG